MFDKQLEQVHEFMSTFGQEIKTDITNLPSNKIMKLRHELLKEEVRELAEGIENGDIVEIADALIDIQYVLDGAFLAFGLKDIKEKLFDEVHRSNLSKLDEDGNVLYREDGKVRKSDLYTPPDLKSIIEEFKNAKK